MGGTILRLLSAGLLGASSAMLPACNGLFEGLYDQPAASSDYGFVVVDEPTRSGTIYVDATSYTDWVYIDLHGKCVVAADVSAAAPAAWDFAVHRYDARTDGGSVLETPYADFESLRAAGVMPSGTFVEDVWTTQQIAVDMSHMMDGYLVYAESFYNPELSRWLDVDTSAMPPIYTASNRIYLLRLQDGSCAALRLTAYMNDASIKGFLTIDYVYPFEL